MGQNYPSQLIDSKAVRASRILEAFITLLWNGTRTLSRIVQVLASISQLLFVRDPLIQF